MVSYDGTPAEEENEIFFDDQLELDTTLEGAENSHSSSGENVGNNQMDDEFDSDVSRKTSQSEE